MTIEIRTQYIHNTSTKLADSPARSPPEDQLYPLQTSLEVYRVSFPLS